MAFLLNGEFTITQRSLSIFLLNLLVEIFKCCGHLEIPRGNMPGTLLGTAGSGRFSRLRSLRSTSISHQIILATWVIERNRNLGTGQAVQQLSLILMSST